MTLSSLHVLREQVHYGWNSQHEPIATVASGSEVSFDTADASGGQLRPGCTHESINDFDLDRTNPVCGPIFVDGAHPGDTLQVDILAVEPGTYGWTGILPGFGLLADEFPDPWLHIWEFDGGCGVFSDRVRVPLQPFCGVLGVAPSAPGLHSVLPPRRVGGNLDTRQLGEGATLYLPVEVEGALFGVGDTHGAQGDGEVCGTAIEGAMTVTLRLTIRPDLVVDTPEFDVRRPLERPAAAAAGYHGTTGVGPDLMEAARQSIRQMIQHLERRRGLSREQAYALCSVAVDLRISEVVDEPNWVVSAFLPNDLFGPG